MSGRVIRFEGSAHQEAERLLPWLVNGTLDEQERDRVQRHLAECTACQHEVDWLRSLQRACLDSADPAPAPVHAARRLRRRVQAAQSAVRHGTTARRRWLVWVIAAQAALLLVLSITLVQVSRVDTPAYHTLGAATGPQARLVVVFDPNLSEARMRRLMRASDARVVDGPTEAGAYELSVPAAREAAVREALRAAPGVRMVERLGPGDGR